MELSSINNWKMEFYVLFVALFCRPPGVGRCSEVHRNAGNCCVLCLRLLSFCFSTEYFSIYFLFSENSNLMGLFLCDIYAENVATSISKTPELS